MTEQFHIEETGSPVCNGIALLSAEENSERIGLIILIIKNKKARRNSLPGCLLEGDSQV